MYPKLDTGISTFIISKGFYSQFFYHNSLVRASTITKNILRDDFLESMEI